MPATVNKYRIKDLATITKSSDLLNKIIEVETDNGTDQNSQVSVPLLVQTVADNLPAPQKVSYISVRTYDTTDPHYLPGYATLVSESLSKDLVMWMTARVEFPNNPSKYYRLTYNQTGTGKFFAYVDTTYTSNKLSCDWVEIDSPDDRASNVPDFNALTAYSKDDSVKYRVGGSLRIFVAKQNLALAAFPPTNQVPAPTGLVTDAYWTELNTELAPNYSRLGQIVCRFYYNAERDQYGGDTVEDLLARENAGAGILYSNRSIMVELGPNAGAYEVTYDPSGNAPFMAYVDGSFATGRNPSKLRKTVAGSAGTIITLTNITENVGGFHAGESFVGSEQEAWNKLLITYQNPAFSAFTFDDQGTRTLLTGTRIPNQSHVFTWGTSNGANIQPNSVSIQDVTTNTQLVSNTTNDGVESATFGGYTIGVGESRRYRITATTTNGNTIAADVVLYGALARFWGASSLTPSQLKAQLTSGAPIDPNGLNFQQDLATTISSNITVDCSGGKYVYFLYDANLPNPTVVRAGVNTFSAYTVQALNLTDQLGNSRAYNFLYTGIQYGSTVNVNVIS